MQVLLTRWKPRLRKLPGYRAARLLFDLVKGRESRNAALLLLRPPKGLYQPYGTTSADRYPQVFEQVRSQIEDSSEMHILSFGCSTGEEVFSLRHYFPQAFLVGLDINPRNIAACLSRCRKQGDTRMSFAVAGSTAGEKDSTYDAVFAMAVFRHGDLNLSPPPPRCDHRIHFADFEQSVTDLARVLKPGGLLVVDHAMFRFADTRIAKDFETVFSRQLNENAPLYGRDDCLLTDVEGSEAVLRKLP